LQAFTLHEIKGDFGFMRMRRVHPRPLHDEVRTLPIVTAVEGARTRMEIICKMHFRVENSGVNHLCSSRHAS
jgi:hypothetical protein